jgi:hypothetical protein
MSRAEKRLAAMKRNPRDDWTIEDVVALCRGFGLSCKPPASGSHYTVSHPDVPGILTVPARRPIKPVYIILLVELVECVLEAR